jgi:hypothetical protein
MNKFINQSIQSRQTELDAIGFVGKKGNANSSFISAIGTRKQKSDDGYDEDESAVVADFDKK